MTHTQRLKEIAKFASGLVLGDLLTGVWMLSSGLLPQSFMGIWVTSQTAWFWIGFDLFLLLVLIHYAWHPRSMEPGASPKSLFFVVGVITGLVALAHFLRLVFGWSVMIGAWAAPMWMSWIAIFVAAFISYTSFHLASRK
ncbi:hypothetical protein KGO95_03420 [Patescibacteria group bacterium]|nr:hypothetical protein [Patescibacteria group bacterium]